MFKIYFKLAYRNLFKNKIYTLINLSSLALGIACCLVITLYVFEELSYDDFHENADQIYRLTTYAQIGENTWNSVVVSPAIGPVIVEEISEVLTSVRVNQFDKIKVRRKDKIFLEDNVIAADKDFFKLFSFPLQRGNASNVLSDLMSVVISESFAQKYFDAKEDPVGETIQINEDEYTVTSIMADVTQNSHIHFDLVFSYMSLPRAKNPNWSNSNTLTYLLVEKNTRVEVLEKKIAAMMQKYSNHYRQIKEAGFSWTIASQPLKSIHLYSHLEDELEANGNIRNIYLFTTIALFILLIAIINFMNLTTARSADRAKEVGIRKTLGSKRSELIWQFLMESIIVTLLATFIALGMVEILKVLLQAIAGRPLATRIVDQPVLLLGIAIISILVGMIAGIYPAFYLSRFNPASILGGRLVLGNKRGILRNGLVVFQFVISIGLITSTIIIWKQLEYVRNKDLGLDRENVVLIRNAGELGDNFNAFVQELNNNPRITSTSISDFAPFDDLQGSLFLAQGKDVTEARIINFMLVDQNFIPTMGIDLIEGRNFSLNMGTDSLAMILNESAVKALGLNSPLNQLIDWNEPMHVIGVTQNFHFKSMREEIAPLILMYGRRGDVISTRIKMGEIGSALTFLEDHWSKYSKGNSPLYYNFLDADFEEMYYADQRLGKIFGVFSLLAIFIACLGLFALAAFIAERRVKEIGVRKVLGASTTSLITLISKDFMWSMIIAFIIASPVAYYFMDNWLQDFVYHITIQWWIFILAGAISILIALFTVSFHSIKVAMADPVESLRSE